ncbi:wd-repeat protein [Leptolyngbya sp. Heron Island J]|nr:wd-repeat protein [Leptolyngbya sp. Heron Island J]
MVNDIRSRAVQLVETLPQKQLADAVRFLELLSKLEMYVPKTKQEAELVATIQRRLSSEEQQRLDHLRDRNQQGVSLADSEYKELIGLEDKLEKFALERLNALIQLADLTHIGLATLNQRFKAMPNNSHAIESGASHIPDQANRSDQSP